MGKLEVTGPDSLPFLQWLTPDDVAASKTEGVTTPLQRKGRRVTGDLSSTATRARTPWLLVVNASNTPKDFEWARARRKRGNRRRERPLRAHRRAGPRAPRRSSPGWLADDPSRPCLLRLPRDVRRRVAGSSSRGPATPARTGSSSTLGADAHRAAGKALLEGGRADGVAPIGLGARDTLRLEMRYALYGNDIDDTADPLEAGLGWVVQAGQGIPRPRGDRGVRAAGPARKLVGLEMTEPLQGPARYPVDRGDGARRDRDVGSYGPSVIGLALAYAARPARPAPRSACRAGRARGSSGGTVHETDAG